MTRLVNFIEYAVIADSDAALGAVLEFQRSGRKGVLCQPGD
jgi:hypothetical protein